MKKTKDNEINNIISRAEEYRRNLSDQVLNNFNDLDKLANIFIKSFSSENKKK